MVQSITKTLRGGGALLVAALLALSLIPVTKAWAADKYNLTLVSTLTGATAVASDDTNLEYDYTSIITATPESGKAFVDAPTIAVDGCEVTEPFAPDPMSRNGSWDAVVSHFTKDATVTVSGEAVVSYTATLDTANLKGATAELGKTEGIQPNDVVNVTIKPAEGKRFDAAPTMTLDGATVKAELQKRPADGAYVGTISTFTKNAKVTISGEAVDAWSATIDKAGLTGGTATIAPKDGLGPDSVAILDVIFDGDKKVVGDPVVTADKASSVKLALKNGNTYTYEITGFTGNTVVKVVGEAKGESWSATLDTAGLKGATATLDKTSGILSSNIVWLKIVPEAGKSFASDPVVTATNATATISKKASDGSYLFTVTKFTGNATVKVTGEAKAADPKPTPTPDPKPINNGGGTGGNTLAKTGDPLDAAPLAGILGVSAVALAGAFALRRKVGSE